MSLFAFFRSSFAEEISRAEKTPGARIVDVRTEEEYAAGHLPAAENIPLGPTGGDRREEESGGGHPPPAENIPLDRLASARFAQGEKLFVYCHSGARSARAAAYLKSQGLDAVNMGGIAGYKGKLIGGK